MELSRANDDKPKAKRRRETGFEEYGGYMGAKERKLALQNEQRHTNFNKEVSSISCDSTISKSNANIFIGTKIHINGYTKPSSDALRDLIVSRGGQMVHFFQKTKVTHMLAMNLPQSKINSLLKVNAAQGGQSGHSSQPVKVVHPNWILDCVAAGRLLSSTPYLLFTEEGQKRSEVQRRVKSPSHLPSAIPKQPAISSEESTIEQMIVGESETRPISDNTGDALFESSGILFEETSSNEKTTEIPRNQQLNASQEGDGRRKDEVGILASANVDFPSDNLSLLITESLFEESQKQQETDEPPAENISNLTEFESGTSNRKKCENSAALDRVHQWKLTSNPNNESNTCMQTNRLNVASSSKFDSSSRIAKAGDKDFLKEFYGNSRLHHISMWGSQFKQLVKQFQTKPPKDAINWDTFEPQDADFNLSSINHRCKPCCWEPALNDHSNEVKVILHVDMDCFFVSVGLLKHPELRGQPVAVTHSKGSGPVVSDEVSGGTKTDILKSYAEIASCSYEARSRGVKNGMLMKNAVVLCPELKTIPYNFEEYHETAATMYNIVARYSRVIQAVSCDECFVDITNCVNKSNLTPCQIATLIVSEIFAKTKCSASVGVSTNMLLCRLATKSAKPNGIFSIGSENQRVLFKHLDTLNVMDLPGVGFSSRSQLQSIGVGTIADLRLRELVELKSVLGGKTGEMLYNYSRGIDNRELNSVIKRKSVSAEINYGIRLSKMDQVYSFVGELICEVHRRLLECEMVTKSICLKLRIRAQDQPKETKKFMGCGICDTVNKSKNLLSYSNNLDLLKREVSQILKNIKFDPSDLRGVGITLNKLADESNAVSPSKFRDISKMFSRSKNSNVNCKKELKYPPTAGGNSAAAINVSEAVKKLKLCQVGSIKTHQPETKYNCNKNESVSNLGRNSTLWSKAAQKSGVYISPNENDEPGPSECRLPTIDLDDLNDYLLDSDDNDPSVAITSKVKRSPDVNTRLMQNQRAKSRRKTQIQNQITIRYVAPEVKKSVWNRSEPAKNKKFASNIDDNKYEEQFPCFGDASNIDKACKLLYDWITEPNSELTEMDSDILADFCSELIKRDYLFQLTVFLRCMRRLIVGRNSPEWNSVFNQVCSRALENVRAKTGIKLKL